MKVLVVMVLLAGCAKATPGGGGFRVFYPDANDQGITAKAGRRMQAKPAADCRNAEGALARWANSGARVVEGALPAGLVVEDGAIVGVPATPGVYRAKVKFSGVTCGSTPIVDQLVDVAIRVR